MALTLQLQLSSPALLYILLLQVPIPRAQSTGVASLGQEEAQEVFQKIRTQIMMSLTARKVVQKAIGRSNQIHRSESKTSPFESTTQGIGDDLLVPGEKLVIPPNRIEILVMKCQSWVSVQLNPLNFWNMKVKVKVTGLVFFVKKLDKERVDGDRIIGFHT